MSLPVGFLSGAESELQEVFNRFEDFRESFGDEFMALVETYLARIAVFPEIAPIYCDRVRRQVIQKFPYGIFYEAYPTRVVVVALLDLRQDQSQILRRVRH